jgi:hypothetical protein
MTKRTITILALLSMLALPTLAADDDVCPCIPLTRVWVTQACPTWNCAQAAMVMANGDPYVMALPTADTKYGWVVVRRVVSGGAIQFPEDAFVCTSHATVSEAMNAFVGADPGTMPLLTTSVDGVALVIRLRQAAPGRKRAAAR